MKSLKWSEKEKQKYLGKWFRGRLGYKARWERLYRKLDGTWYATRCYGCLLAWKMYHKSGCLCEERGSPILRDNKGRFRAH